MKKESNLKRLLRYAGGYKYLTIASWIFSALSALVALLPFVYIWNTEKSPILFQRIRLFQCPLKSRLPVFCLYVVYLLDLKKRIEHTS